MKALRLLAPLPHAQTGLTRLGEFKVSSTTSEDPSLAAAHHTH